VPGLLASPLQSWSGLLDRARAGQAPDLRNPQDTSDAANVVMSGLTGGLLAAPKGAVLGAGPVRPSLLGMFPTTRPRAIQNATRVQGGYSVHLPTGASPNEGLMMGKYRNTDPRNVVVEGRPLSAADLEGFVAKNRKVIERPEYNLSTWRDPETGKTYVDVSQRFKPDQIREATKFGERTGQISGYDIGKGETFPVGRLPDFVRGPEFAQRQTELAAKGQEYLRGIGAPENWWPIQGTPLEQVYGSQNLPALSGYIAATAPNTAPRQNMQLATEYMRRHLRGEPAVQPGYRTPEGLLSMAPGKKMPLESSRIPNLKRTQAGDLQALSREKVNREGSALLGDPNAVVVDRWHIRTAEDPARGIYVAPEEGVIGSSANYRLIEKAIQDAARAQGVDPAVFSAWSWTGAREQARNMGNLLGVPYKKGSIPAESYGYPSHFSDLLVAKARQLGTTPEHIAQLLRDGEINLMAGPSGLLGLPSAAPEQPRPARP
jgi:hypothetical protein